MGQGVGRLAGRVGVAVGLVVLVALGPGCGGQEGGPKSLSMNAGGGSAWHAEYVGCSELLALQGDIAPIDGLGVAVRLAPTDVGSVDASPRQLRVAVLRPGWLSHQVGYCALKVGNLLSEADAWSTTTEQVGEESPDWTGVLLAKGALALNETLRFTYNRRGYQLLFEQLRTRPESGAPGSARIQVASDVSGDEIVTGGAPAADHERVSVLVGLEVVEASKRHYGYWPAEM